MARLKKRNTRCIPARRFVPPIYKQHKKPYSHISFYRLTCRLQWQLLNFWTSNHYLPVETVRWNNILIEDIICTLCNAMDIGDEFHYLFICHLFFHNSRVKLLHPYFYTRPCTYKFRELMVNKRIGTIKKLACFINIINNEFKRPWLETPPEPPKTNNILPIYTVSYTRLTIYLFICTWIPGYLY